MGLVRKITRHVLFPVVVAVVALTIAVWASIYGSYSQAQANKKNCENVLVLRDAVKDIVVRASKVSAKNNSYSVEQKLRAARFYADAQARLEQVLCKK